MAETIAWMAGGVAVASIVSAIAAYRILSRKEAVSIEAHRISIPE